MGVMRLILGDYNEPTSLGWKLRNRRAKPIMDLIDAVHQRHGHVKILDVGGTQRYWNIIPREFLAERNCRITLVNLADQVRPATDPIFDSREGNGCDLREFGDKAFHIAHSNSVVEHVGGWAEMKRFAAEMLRVAQNQYVQTPNFWFPMEPHTLTLFYHWLPRQIRVSILQRTSLGYWRRRPDVNDAVEAVDSAQLLDGKMFRALFPDYTVTMERMFLLPKSFVGVRTAPLAAV